MLQLLRVLPERPQPIAIRYGVTAVIIFISCLIQYSLYKVSGFTGYFTLLPGIFLSGFLFDRGSAFIATFFAVLLSLYLLFPLDLTADQLVPLTLFVIVGILCAFVSESMRKTLERL